jgi:hypothetical protein
MRPAFLYYYLAQAQIADRRRQARRDAPAPAAQPTRDTPAPQRPHRARRFPAIVKRRVLTVLGGGSP